MNTDVANLLLIGAADHPVGIFPRMANRHGLIAGATGTGKTITLQGIAQSFSDMGVPVFVPDIKGDFSGIAAPGAMSDRLLERAQRVGIENFEVYGAPTIFWDVFGELGHPLRLTVADFGPALLARLLNLNETQTGLMQIIFRVADDRQWLLLDLKDLRAMVGWVAENRSDLMSNYGMIAPASIGAIQRALLNFEMQGGENLFGEPAITLENLLGVDANGRGIVNILAADKLYRTSPLIYSSLLLWLLSELFEQLPEVGDAKKPHFVLFFDEAHLLFKDTPKSLIDRIEQVVRLIRSKGVGVYFVTQSPLDVPESILGQLGNRVQHALRAFTPRDQRAVRTAAQTFRPNPDLDTEAVISEMGVGEALVSVLDDHGIPTPVERVLIRPPASRMGPLNTDERKAIIDNSPFAGVFDVAIDRESAYEILQQQAEEALSEDTPPKTQVMDKKQKSKILGTRQDYGSKSSSGAIDAILGASSQGMVKAIGAKIGRQIVRGVLGSLSSKRR